MKASGVVLRRSLLSGILMIFIFFCAFPQKVIMDTTYLRSNNTDGVNALTPSGGTGAIMFATAFRWNKSGPTGGYWSDNEINDNVFRPVFTNVAKYTLQVFNRNGYKVFESSDLYRGWDGYLDNGDRAMQGVYIWKASGTFSDGTSYTKTGDVTFIF